jgi:hypothetical protein
MLRHIDAALGFRAHTGWAVAVAVAQNREILERRRISFEPGSSRFVYHQAAENPASAEAAISTARAATLAAASREIGNLVAALAERNVRVQRACIPAGNTRLPAALAEIIAAHSRIHAAEGAFYRDVLADACKQLKIRVTRAPERDLSKLAADSLNLTPEKFLARLQETGRRMGAPWGEDQRRATLAAFVALAAGRAALAGG